MAYYDTCCNNQQKLLFGGCDECDPPEEDDLTEDEFARLATRATGEPPLDPENWSFDVTTALHDDMKGGGGYRTVRSRVTVSREAFPKWTTAAEVAAGMAVCHHGGMPTEILARY